MDNDTIFDWFRLYMDSHRRVKYADVAKQAGISRQALYLAYRGIGGAKTIEAINKYKQEIEK